MLLTDRTPRSATTQSTVIPAVTTTAESWIEDTHECRRSPYCRFYSLVTEPLGERLDDVSVEEIRWYARQFRVEQAMLNIERRWEGLPTLLV